MNHSTSTLTSNCLHSTKPHAKSIWLLWNYSRSFVYAKSTRSNYIWRFIGQLHFGCVRYSYVCMEFGMFHKFQTIFIIRESVACKLIRKKRRSFASDCFCIILWNVLLIISISRILVEICAHWIFWQSYGIRVGQHQNRTDNWQFKIYRNAWYKHVGLTRETTIRLLNRRILPQLKALSQTSTNLAIHNQ